MTSVPSASRSAAIATLPTDAAVPAARPCVDITAITSRDDFLLELGEALGGKASVRPVESLHAALDGMRTPRRGQVGQVLVIDARGVTDVRAAVEAASATSARPAVVVFAEGPAEQELAEARGAMQIFAVVPLPMDPRKVEAVLEKAIAEVVATGSPKGSAPSPTRIARAHGPVGTLRHPQAVGLDAPVRSRIFPTPLTLGGLAIVLALAAAGAVWLFGHGTRSAAPNRGRSAGGELQAGAAARATEAAETSLVQARIDELLERARLAMHERRFSEPPGDNALLYYRSAAAADRGNPEARDGLQRVASVLAGRLEEALSRSRFDEAAATLASLRAAAPRDARIAPFRQRLYTAQIAHAIANDNLDKAAALVHQAEQSEVVSTDQIARWRADLAHRQQEVRVRRLAALINDRIREGNLIGSDESALGYLQKLQAAAPAHPETQRAVRELVSECLHKAREAALAGQGSEEARWVAGARDAGARPSEITAFQKELAGARAKAAQAESERLLHLARERLKEGRLTDPPEDSTAGYLSQLQASDPGSPGLAEAGQELSKALLERARAASVAGESGDADLAQAQRWGADPSEVAAIAQLQPSAVPAATPSKEIAALAANLKRLRSVSPDYPRNALEQRIEGSVLVEFLVDARGEPRNIQVVESNPPQVFDLAAIDAVRHWRYAPMMVNGTAVEVPVKTRMRFQLPK